MKNRQIEISREDFQAMVEAYTRKGWTVVGRGIRGIYVERDGERRTLFPR